MHDPDARPPIAAVVDDLAHAVQRAMKGDPASFRAGYSFANAVLAVASTAGYDSPTQVAILAQRVHEQLTAAPTDVLVSATAARCRGSLAVVVPSTQRTHTDAVCQDCGEWVRIIAGVLAEHSRPADQDWGLTPPVDA